jgi:hypothetical protein
MTTGPGSWGNMQITRYPGARYRYEWPGAAARIALVMASLTAK